MLSNHTDIQSYKTHMPSDLPYSPIIQIHMPSNHTVLDRLSLSQLVSHSISRSVGRTCLRLVSGCRPPRRSTPFPVGLCPDVSRIRLMRKSCPRPILSSELSVLADALPRDGTEITGQAAEPAGVRRHVTMSRDSRMTKQPDVSGRGPAGFHMRPYRNSSLHRTSLYRIPRVYRDWAS